MNLKSRYRKYPYTNKNAKITIIDVEKYLKGNKDIMFSDEKIYKGIFPSWDNTARKAKSGALAFLTSPTIYKTWLKDILEWTIKNHPKENRFVFINAWNEWAEGAHLEPCLKYGYGYLQATKEALEEIADM